MFVGCVYLLLMVFACLVGCCFNSVVSGFCVLFDWFAVAYGVDLALLLFVGCFCYCLVVSGLVGLRLGVGWLICVLAFGLLIYFGSACLFCIC